MDNIESRVISAIKKTLGNDKEINSNTDLAKDYSLDSLTRTEIIMDLEDEFEITIPDEDITKIFEYETKSPGVYDISKKVDELKVSNIHSYITGKLKEIKSYTH